MKPSALLVLTSLVSILLLTIHIAQDIVLSGLELAKPRKRPAGLAV